MRICIFCSSKSNLSESTFEQATLLSDYMAENNDGFLYGGGNGGLMGYFADRMVERKVESIGVIPDGAFSQEVAHQGLTELIYTKDMLDRKGVMMEKSDAFVIFPGGIGTMDEALEVMTWETVYKLNKPIFFFNWQGFWDPFIEMIKAYEKTKLFYPETMSSFRVANTMEELCKEIDATR